LKRKAVSPIEVDQFAFLSPLFRGGVEAVLACEWTSVGMCVVSLQHLMAFWSAHLVFGDI